MRKVLVKGEDTKRKIYLHIQSGVGRKEVHPIFIDQQWVEVPVNSDVADIAALDELLDTLESPVSGIYASHCLENLHPFQAQQAIKHWRQTLEDKGVLIIRCLDNETQRLGCIGYTRKTLEMTLLTFGFSSVNVLNDGADLISFSRK